MVKVIVRDRSCRPIQQFEVLSGKIFDDGGRVDGIPIENMTGPSCTTIVSRTHLQIKTMAQWLVPVKGEEGWFCAHRAKHIAAINP